MRKNVEYLKTVAHDSYLDGLAQAGISTDKIPSMYGMNRILEKIGWAAVAVDGLIPTDAFLEFQAYNVLVIASEIRSIDEIEYTPIPDIIHESAGHAPIIANPEYSEFLRRMGQIGCKAISSHKDEVLEKAVRKLTELKINPNATESEIIEAERDVVDIQNHQSHLSEMTAIRNLHWWSVEYGLIGELDDYKIYGAGLLSSIGESKWCRSAEVKKVPYSLETAKQHFDYTKPQPQLFVTPDFAHLSFVVEEYANTMALRRGGVEAVKKIIESRKLGTVELSTGIQISGLFTDQVLDDRGRIAYVFTEGPTALAYREKELIGHGVINHPDGFGSPVGKLKSINIAIEDMSPRDLEAYNIYEGRRVTLEFEGQITVDGEVITGIRNLQGKILLIRFKNCLVKHRDRILFNQDMGIYDMAVGKEIMSGFAGPADLNSFDLIVHEVKENEIHTPPSSEKLLLEKYYNWAQKATEKGEVTELEENVQFITANFPDEWLLLMEYKIICEKLGKEQLCQSIENALRNLQSRRKEIQHLIT